MVSQWRQGEIGRRPVRIANCSGYIGDDPEEMLKQATLGDIDFITGDYLAEVNIALNAEAFARGEHPGYEPSAWQGLERSIDVINQKQIKVALNGGALNPAGLAQKTAELVSAKGYNLKVAYISGDDVLSQMARTMPTTKDEALPHLDSSNEHLQQITEAFLFTRNSSSPPQIVSANAYLGARAIWKAFHADADIVICGRVSDASPVIAAAWYWWKWSETDCDCLAGALIGGHLIECSAYVTGGNFAGFDQYDIEKFIDPGFPIAEIAKDGTAVITKHPNTGGLVNVDTCRSQFLYELQGDVYLNSDVKAYISGIEFEQVGEDRVQVQGTKGAPPPPTTKLALFYKGGYEIQVLVNSTGYAYKQKFELFKRQIRYYAGEAELEKLDVLDIQCIGAPAPDSAVQNDNTVYFRIFGQASDVKTLVPLSDAWRKISLKHFHGFHCSMDMRTAIPRPYLAYYPALWPQEKLEEAVHILGGHERGNSFPTGSPPAYEALEQRLSYDTKDPISLSGPTSKIRLGDVALARSGDKGGNLNCGVFVGSKERWDWLRSYLSSARISDMLGEEMLPDYAVERVEFPGIFAMHFVVYGILGRGVSSSKRLDGFGKGFADYFRDKLVDFPEDLI